MSLDHERLRRCYETARNALLTERNTHGHWEGELSTSALSTATAVMALEMVRRHPASGGREPAGKAYDASPTNADDHPRADAHGSPQTLQPLIDGGLRWLADHQNDDGGWGDTTKSFSNISTSMLAHAVFYATGNTEGEFQSVVEAAKSYIDRIGGVDAVIKRYGKDKTFSIPILTHCALAGLVPWKAVSALPFELACLPPNFYKTVRLPVVSYALPALIAIGQVRHHFRKPWTPLFRAIRWLAIKPSLRRLESIQPSNGGFLEAAPLTSFVTMSLAGMGLADHPVAKKGLQFLLDSVRPDGSWPIDTNLATWVTTMSVAALGDDLPEADRPAIREWLLGQQYEVVHPYTNADPGGWAWTDLPGGVPDADDTPGAMLALMTLEQREPQASGGRKPAGNAEGPGNADHRFATESDCVNQESQSPSTDKNDNGDSVPSTQYSELGTQHSLSKPQSSTATSSDSAIKASLDKAIHWLLGIQNRDGGFPTFCRGWGTLPFDRSSADITAHCLRGLTRWIHDDLGIIPEEGVRYRLPQGGYGSIDAVNRGFRYLKKAQRPDGSWLPLWFGNQHAPDDINPTYGTAKVLAAYRDCNRIGTSEAQRGLEWLKANQNDDGGWGGVKGTPSSIEETSLAVEILLSVESAGESGQRGLGWLLDRVERNTYCETAPIGFYFAKLWYFERLYPLSLIVAALRRAVQQNSPSDTPETSTDSMRNSSLAEQD